MKPNFQLNIILIDEIWENSIKKISQLGYKASPILKDS
jgi:hypothetical protein